MVRGQLLMVFGLGSLDLDQNGSAPILWPLFLISIPKVYFQNEPDNDRQTSKTKDPRPKRLATDH
jgi:hypothetical protein